MGFNSAFKGLKTYSLRYLTKVKVYLVKSVGSEIYNLVLI